MIDVESRVCVYEVNGEDVPVGDNRPKIIVKSHWNEKDKVVIHVDGKRWTVVAGDLLAAITNAKNSNRF